MPVHLSMFGIGKIQNTKIEFDRNMESVSDLFHKLISHIRAMREFWKKKHFKWAYSTHLLLGWPLWLWLRRFFVVAVVWLSDTFQETSGALSNGQFCRLFGAFGAIQWIATARRHKRWSWRWKCRCWSAYNRFWYIFHGKMKFARHSVGWNETY